MISDMASVYASSSRTFLGRLIRFGGGGGGINSVSRERRTRAEELEDSIAEKSRRPVLESRCWRSVGKRSPSVMELMRQ